METALLQAIAPAGVAGVVLFWFMLRAESRLDRLERAIDRLSRTQLLALLDDERTSEQVRRQARAILAEMPATAQQLVEAGR